jgi:hypothetical protein
MIGRYLIPLVAALSISVLPVEAKQPPKPSAEVLAAITRRGVALAEYDTAASHASDAVEASHPPEGSVRRYVARKTDQGWVVDFGKLSEDGSAFDVSREAIQSGSSSQFAVTAFDTVRPDTGWDLAAARGIDLALKDFRGANRPYNVAVLPNESGNLFVYVYLAQTQVGVYPYGADVRYRISADGNSILEKRQLHKSVIEAPPIPPSPKPAGGYHTHVLSDLPEDTDVLLVLQRVPRTPEFVGAGGYVFKVDEDGTITIAGRLP